MQGGDHLGWWRWWGWRWWEESVSICVWLRDVVEVSEFQWTCMNWMVRVLVRFWFWKDMIQIKYWKKSDYFKFVMKEWEENISDKKLAILVRHIRCTRPSTHKEFSWWALCFVCLLIVTLFSQVRVGGLQKPMGSQPMRGYPSRNDQQTLQRQYKCQLTLPCNPARIRKSRKGVGNVVVWWSWSGVISHGCGRLLLGRGDVTIAAVVCLVVVGC